MEPKSSQPQAFYRWVDAQGRLHVVSSLDAVPVAERAKAERVTLTGDTAIGSVPASVPTSAPAKAAWHFDLGSFGIGVGVALAVALILRWMPGAGRGLLRVAVVLGIAALLTGLYLGSIRRATGASEGGAIATPSAMIEDAKAAVEKLNQRQKQQDEELRKLQAEGR